MKVIIEMVKGKKAKGVRYLEGIKMLDTDYKSKEMYGKKGEYKLTDQLGKEYIVRREVFNKLREIMNK